jgi:hypothetical protein
MQPLICTSTFLASLFLAVVVGMAAEVGECPVASIAFDLQDLQGKIHSLSQNDQGMVRVFVFLSTACPIASSYIPELNRLTNSAPRGAQIYGVISDSTQNRAEASRHFQAYKASFPVLFDPSGLLADVLRPTHVPEAFVLNADGGIAYRGAIDNAYQSIGRRRANVEHHYAEDAVTALVRGEQVVTSFKLPVGCHFPKVLPLAESAGVTYCRDVAPILQMRCMDCHRPGQVAPFALTNHTEAAKHATMIVEVTQRRLMPPWMPGAGGRPKFVAERRLTDRELGILKAWSEAGCPEGDLADLPPNPPFVEGWRLGTPDLIVKIPEPFSIRAEGPDLLQNFVIPLDISEDKLVAVVDFHPGNQRVVHHAVLFLDDKGQARKLDRATPEPGYSNFGGPGFFPSGALGGWSVGNTPRRLPKEMGRYLKKGSDLVVQIHYHPTGKLEADQSELGIYFVPKPVAASLQEPAKLVGSVWLANYEIDIPAGDKEYRCRAQYTLPKDVTLVGIVPHMHLLGKSMTVTATFPDGGEHALIDLPDWNYNWQDEYYLERPFTLPANTRLQVSAIFDNSADNPSNPSLPPKRVTWGDQTTDEMLFCFLLLTAENSTDLIHVIYDNLAHDTQQPRRKK